MSFPAIKPAFTPGPYRFEKLTSTDLVIVGKPTWPCRRFGADGEWDVAVLDDMCGNYSEALANARLFIASPDLFRFVAGFAAGEVQGANPMIVESARALIGKVLA